MGCPQHGLKARHNTRAIGPKEVAQHPDRYGPKSRVIGKVMKLSFQPYKYLLKRTPYVAMASFLVQTVSGIRERNEVQVEDDWDLNVYISDAAMSSSG